MYGTYSASASTSNGAAIASVALPVRAGPHGIVARALSGGVGALGSVGQERTRRTVSRQFCGTLHAQPARTGPSGVLARARDRSERAPCTVGNTAACLTRFGRLC